MAMVSHENMVAATMNDAPFHQPSQHSPQDPNRNSSNPNTCSQTTPPEPHPSADPAIATDSPAAQQDAVSKQPPLSSLPASEALQLLSAGIELLVRMTGDIPPTPPLKTPTNPQMSDMQKEKVNIARSLSERSLARLREAEKLKEEARRRQQNQQQQSPHSQQGKDQVQAYREAMTSQLLAQQQQAAVAAATAAAATASGLPCQGGAIDGVQLRKGSLASPASSAGSGSGSQPPEPYIIIGADSEPVNRQHSAITRKFYSKNEPPITIAQYLLRLHQFCPMSTAVYLAASLYIHRLAVEERAIPVTRRNAHRLVLAGLRVAMKALEDLSYPHGKIAKVGGVSEAELARLEISFCFLAGFELVVKEESLWRHWMVLREGRAGEALGRMTESEFGDLRIGRRKREEQAG